MDIIHNKNFTIGFNEEINATYLIFNKKVDYETFTSAHKKLLEVFRDKKSGKHLTDGDKLGAVSSEGKEWVAKKTIPEMAKVSPGNIVYMAFKFSKEVFAQYTSKNIAGKTTSISEVKFFGNLDNAKEWLQSI